MIYPSNQNPRNLSSPVQQELEAATASDDVLAILFSFTHQFFEYAALFVVHGDLAEGRDASGPGADRERVAGIGVPLDQPSSLSLARERRAPVVGPGYCTNSTVPPVSVFISCSTCGSSM